MKKVKLLNPILMSTIIAGAIVPIASCSNGQTEISIMSSQTKQYMHSTNADPYPVFVLKLKNNLKEGQSIKVNVKNIYGTKNVTCSVLGTNIENNNVLVAMKMDNFLFAGDYCDFSLEVECLNSNNSVAWRNTLSGFRLVAALPYRYYVNNLYEKTVQEFVEWSKNPHPSNPKSTHTLEDDTLNVARNYLRNKVNALGYELNRDTYGNVWFDVPATAGYDKYPTLILQGHMDMVAKGFASEEEARTIGIEVVKTTVTDTKGVSHEVLQSKGTATGEGRSTSIGADDGMAIAIVLALLQNSQFEHGPLRVLFTSDEEEGMWGAAALDPSVINSDYLLCLDGEGNSDRPISVSKSCYGFNNYAYTNQFKPIDSSELLQNRYTFTTSGFKGVHFYSNIHYDYEQGGAQLFANPDALIFEALHTLTNNTGYSVQLSQYTHTRRGDEKREAKNMASNATISFATNAPFEAVKKVFESLFTNVQDKYKLEDGNIVFGISPIADPTAYKFVSAADSSKLIKVFAENIKYDIQHWDGDDIEDEQERKQQMTKRDYPTQCSNFSFTEIDENCFFSGFSRANAATQAYIDELELHNAYGWTSEFGTGGLVKSSTHGPWDPTGKEELLNLTQEGFEATIHEQPYFSKVRGGVEPAYFCKYRSTLQQSVIGPWLEDIHTVNETCYLETLPKIIKCTLYIIDNMWKFIK